MDDGLPLTSQGSGRNAAHPSLAESHRSISIPRGAGFWRKLLAFSGPGYLVAVGYMDSGQLPPTSREARNSGTPS